MPSFKLKVFVPVSSAPCTVYQYFPASVLHERTPPVRRESTENRHPTNSLLEPGVRCSGAPLRRIGAPPYLLLTAYLLPSKHPQLTYEFRKLLHLLFIPFMVAICFHGRPLRILGAVLLTWYLADRLYFTTKMTFLVSAPIYKSVGRGTLVRFDLPE